MFSLSHLAHFDGSFLLNSVRSVLSRNVHNISLAFCGNQWKPIFESNAALKKTGCLERVGTCDIWAYYTEDWWTQETINSLVSKRSGRLVVVFSVDSVWQLIILCCLRPSLDIG